MRRSNQARGFARGFWDRGRVVVDDIVQIDGDHSLHAGRERMKGWEPTTGSTGF